MHVVTIYSIDDEARNSTKSEVSFYKGVSKILHIIKTFLVKKKKFRLFLF